MTNERRQAFTFVEVLLALLIVAMGLGPIILFYRQGTKVAAFNEEHLLARYRARRILESISALDYETIRQLAGRATYPALGVRGMPTGLDGLPTLLPAVQYELPVMADQIPLPPYLEHFKEKLGLFHEAVFWEQLDADGFGRIIVIVSWHQPGEVPTSPPHVYRHVKFVYRAEISLFQRPPLGGAAS